MKDILPIVTVLAILVVVPLILFLLVREKIRSDSASKLAMIEKGIVVHDENHNKHSHSNKILDNGINSVGIALGLITGYLLTRFLEINGWVAYPAMVLLFKGASLLLYRIYLKK